MFSYDYCYGYYQQDAHRAYASIYISLGDFEVFHPTGATRCINGMKFGMDDATKGGLLCLTPRHMLPQSQQSWGA